MKRSSSFSVSRRGALAASTVAAVGAVIVAVPALAISASATQPGSDGHKVTICHRNNDDKKPYVTETVDIASSGLLKAGHDGHTGDIWAAGMKSDHDKWGDIIPSYTYTDGDFTFTYEGLNWTTEGQDIWNNDCTVVLPTPTETTPSGDPSPEDSTPATDPSPQESTPVTDPSPQESNTNAPQGGGDPSPQESTPVTDPSPQESTPVTDPSPQESTPVTDPSPEQSTPANPGDPQGSGDPTPTESAPVDPGTPAETPSEDPGLPNTGSNGSTLPKTGSDTTALLALATGLVTVGAASIVVARRRTEVETD